MPILTILAIRALPEPPKLLRLNRLYEELAHNIRRRLRVPMFAQHNRPQLILVPLIHRIRHLLLSAVLVQVLLLDLAAHVEIVAELALVAFIAVARLVEGAQYGLGVDPEGHFLDLYGLEEGGFFFLALGFVGFGFFAHSLFALFLEDVAGFACHGLLLLDRGDLLFDFGGFVFLKLNTLDRGSW